MFYNRVILWKQGLHKKMKSVENKVFWARLASFGQLGIISDPKISSKGIKDLNGLENKIHTMMKGRETLYYDHTVPFYEPERH